MVTDIQANSDFALHIESTGGAHNYTVLQNSSDTLNAYAFTDHFDRQHTIDVQYKVLVPSKVRVISDGTYSISVSDGAEII